MKNYFKIIRPANLLFLGILTAFFYFGVLTPLLGQYGIRIPGSVPIFVLLEISAIFIAAGGYVVNDYFDTKIDEINRPSKVIVGHGMSRKQAAVYFQCLFAIGIAAGIALAVIVGDFTLAFLYLVVAGLLWFYSSSYKRQFLIGNLIIAICAFAAIFIPGYAVAAAMIRHYDFLIYQTGILPEIYSWSCAIGLCSLLLTFVREIVKDMEDVEGDRENECRTMPVVWGIAKSKIFVAVMAAASLDVMGYFAFFLSPFENDPVSGKYYLTGIVLPFLIFFYMLGKAGCKKEFHNISSLLKYIMAIGCCYCLFVYYLILLNSPSYVAY